MLISTYVLKAKSIYLAIFEQLQIISIEGITGQVKPKLMGDRMVGGIAVQETMLLPGAKESAVAHIALWADPKLKSITELRDSKGLVYDKHVAKCIPETGGSYRLPGTLDGIVHVPVLDCIHMH